MYKRIVPILLLSILSLFLFGCYNTSYCGDNACSSNEDSYSCPQDCGSPQSGVGYLEVYVYDANVGTAIADAQVSVSESVPGECAMDLGNSTGTTTITNVDGLAKFKLESGKNYVVVVNANNYELQGQFSCYNIVDGISKSAKVELVALPAKFQCPGEEGTLELPLGGTIDVNGAIDYNGQILHLGIIDIIKNSPNGEYGRKFVLNSADGGTTLKYYDVYGPMALDDPSYFTNHIYYGGNCWKNGEELPYAIVVPTACNKDTDCASVTNAATCDGNKVVQRVDSYVCANPGTSGAKCIPNDFVTNKIQDCNSCVNGGCSTGLCSDSDGGRNYAVKSQSFSCYYGSMLPGWPVTKICTIARYENCTSDGKLREEYCVGDILNSEFVECPNGCLNGACNP